MTDWSFIDELGTFSMPDPHMHNQLYFPLVNDAGMMSSISPMLHGDIKTGQNSFLMPPVSIEDLHNTRTGRNFWLYIDGFGPWSTGGASARQRAEHFSPNEHETVTLEAGLLWHKLTRQNLEAGIRAETTNFVPTDADRVELMHVAITNIGDRSLSITPTAAIPIYGRSADNIRDHRHVTSLLHRIWTEAYGVIVKPSMSFDERGHQLNKTAYVVIGVEEGTLPPQGFFPVIEDFIGGGGTLDWPEVVVTNMKSTVSPGTYIAGKEALGGMHFSDVTLKPGESRSYFLILGILDADPGISELVDKYGSSDKFKGWMDKNQAFWQDKLSGLRFKTGDDRFDGWLKWVAIQPVLRRLYGNSFLPYHDYGRGGRGWRDLWQDSLALLIMDSTGVDELLWNYYAGVRMDGSNATIIGSEPGEFKADRNDIPRVWMDHGAWPWLTTKLYIDRSGDLEFLFRPQVYFKDKHTNRCQSHDKDWHEELGTELKDQYDQDYQGTILEHLLVQHLTAFFNVGEHNNIRLEGGDWNDGLDMAAVRGESVAFTALYASNLYQISKMVKAWNGSDVQVAAELALLLDTLHDQVNYDSIPAKQERLKAYFAKINKKISGEKITISTRDLASDLKSKASWLYQHLRSNEWIQHSKGSGWFNGYYDNDGQRVEGFDGETTRMTLTGQVFTMMGGIADDQQIRQMVKAANQYLWEESMAGYRLNTNFGKVLTNLGRFSGFAYGHKENGAMFSHMAMMWANALYQRDLVHDGWKVINSLYQHCQEFARSGIYPGIPEYIDPQGKGRYTYLTGSASWLLLTLLNEVLGVKGSLGDLVLEPKLVPEMLDMAGEIQVLTSFADRKIKITYSNPGRLEYGEYAISQVRVNGDVSNFSVNSSIVKIPRDFLNQFLAEDYNEIVVSLREVKSS